MYNPATRRSHNIVKASSFVHPQRQRSSLKFVPKRKLHLIAVAVGNRTAFDPLEFIAARLHHRVQQGLHLALLDLQLLLIGQTLVHAPAADSKMLARLPRAFHRRRLQNGQQAPLAFALALLRQHALNSLTRKGIFYHNPLPIHRYNSFIWKFYHIHNPFKQVAFFHRQFSSFIFFCRVPNMAHSGFQLHLLYQKDPRQPIFFHIRTNAPHIPLLYSHSL